MQVNLYEFFSINTYTTENVCSSHDFLNNIFSSLFSCKHTIYDTYNVQNTCYLFMLLVVKFGGSHEDFQWRGGQHPSPGTVQGSTVYCHKSYENVVSLKVSHAVATLLLVVGWDGKMPTWWEGVRWMTRCEATIDFLVMCREEERLLPDCGWPQVTETSESKPTAKGGPPCCKAVWLF